VEIYRGVMVRVLASMVERVDGGGLESWEELARRLGPLGSRTQKGGGGGGGVADGGGRRRKKRYCEWVRECTEFRRIRRDGGFRIDHRRTERRRTRNIWWSRLTAVWWDKAYLEFPPSL